MKPDIDYTLYLVTDRELMSSASLEECIELAVQGGCTVVQLREKSVSSREFYRLARQAREVTLRLGVPLIINDRVDIALAVGADGVHVGQEDLPCDTVRRLIGRDKVVGVSVSSLAEALIANERGADYLGVGAMYATGTKTNANLTGLDELRRIRAQVEMPVVVIGGINRDTALSFKGTGIDGLAVVSAIVARQDVAGAARKLRALAEAVIRPASE